MRSFTFISGNLGLDLAGTVSHRRSDRSDLLDGPDDLARWTVQAGILDTPPHVDESALATGKALREAVYRLAVPSAGRSSADRELVNRAAAGPPAGVLLRADGEVERAGDLDAALSTVARAAIELLGGPLAARVKECGGEACTRLYLDVSRGSSRRWCDMQECGNRAKAAGFRARRRG
ncbi:ABATE domain-containing protein [Nonomuraea sp. NPDC000554]|uniref:CGNR zinc finger domain-containing protein n=1 Tax=Nonomuraea sp. NPDC000554 TaxID=3154259 RepID=UPI003330749C